VVLLGFRTAGDILLAEEFAALGAKVYIATEDGTAGEKGFVTQVMPRLSYTYLYACGPLPMLRAVDGAAQSGGQLSFEERMGCGFGACMGCSCKTKYGSASARTDRCWKGGKCCGTNNGEPFRLGAGQSCDSRQRHLRLRPGV
jgi:NAD(P)H-flavin reductase